MRESLVEMRNKKVAVAIRKKYQLMTGDLGWLPIFSVSNKDYEIHKIGYNEEDIPLPLSMTGIRQIRYFLSIFPAGSRINVLSHHWRGNLMSVIESLDSWSSQSAIHRRGEIRMVVESPGEVSEKLPILHTEYQTDSLKQSTKERIEEFIAGLTSAMNCSIMSSISALSGSIEGDLELTLLQRRT